MKEKKGNINLPTKITILRIIMAALLIFAIIILYFLDLYKVIDISSYSIHINSIATINIVNIIICIVFILASFTDFLDGYIARKYHLVTDLGKFLDPIADKMLINGLMIFLALNFASLGGDLKFSFFLVIFMSIRDLIVDGLRFMAAQKNIVIAANIFGKLKTVLQMVAIVTVLLNGWPFSYFDANWPEYLHITDFICYIATFVSLLSGTIYLIQNVNIFKGENKNE